MMDVNIRSKAFNSYEIPLYPVTFCIQHGFCYFEKTHCTRGNVFPKAFVTVLSGYGSLASIILQFVMCFQAVCRINLKYYI